MRNLVLAGVAVVLLVLVAAGYLTSVAPAVQFQPAITAIGDATPVNLRVTSPHGVREVNIAVEQSGKRYNLFQKSNPSRRWSFFRASDEPVVISAQIGKKQAPELKEGTARLIATAVGNDFAGKTASTSTDVQIILQPPAVSADGFQHYVNQGGMELVTFITSGSWNEAGVRVGKYTFRSFPLPGKGENERFAMFAFPWDVSPETIPVVYARNTAGAEATARFWFKLFPKKFRSRELPLEDRFLTKVVAELDPNGSGSLSDRFLKINGEMRRQNNQQLADLRLKSEPKVLWQGPFFRLGKVESFFADQRTYLYNAKKIDQQMHLGFDLSDVQGAPVRAANSGRVLHSGPLGIYGNCIVLDHGYGLQSIYGHLRQIDVKPGEMIAKEQVMGKSGDTGLAGGDHLHFSMQIDGVQINPIEWWDAHWIQDRILSKLPPQG
ncbi:MAG: M23 family metallopeptidase [Bryobacteraceae bacterium]|nr:M23 family metallopeptidase [Bryobacteraceae bacterium]